MDDVVFNKFRTLIHDVSGIALGDEKRALVANRIGKRVRKLGLQTPAEYLKIIETDASKEELLELIDVISTNVTHFFREDVHFSFLSDFLANNSSNGKKEFKIWCAAASTGEEPYSIVMTATEALANTSCDFRLLATDICIGALKQADQGLYDAKRVDPVPAALRQKYFRVDQSSGQDQFQVSPTLRKKIVFKRLNLKQRPFPLSGPLDIVFCRNVMIYFDDQLRGQVANGFYNLLRPGGYLILGLSENLLGVEHAFQGLGKSIYQKPGG